MMKKLSIIMMTIMLAMIFAVANGLSSRVAPSTKQTRYVLTPWHNRKLSLGDIQVDYRGDILDVQTSTTRRTIADDPQNVEADSDKQYQPQQQPHLGAARKSSVVKFRVPIPEQEGNIASSLWPASCAATIWWNRYGNYLLEQPQQQQESQQSSSSNKSSTTTRILELGSGLGVTGWATAACLLAQHNGSSNNNNKDDDVTIRHGISLVLTDQDEEAVARLQKSAALNNSKINNLSQQQQQTIKDNNDVDLSKIHVDARVLDWRDDHGDKEGKEEQDKFDIVVGSDISYYQFLLGPLADTIKHYLPRKLLVVASSAKRESMWDFYHLIQDGGYNVKTDTYEKPWPGTTRMLLYHLKNPQDNSTIPMVIMCWTQDAVVAKQLQKWDDLSTLSSSLEDVEVHVATAQDETSVEKSF